MAQTRWERSRETSSALYPSLWRPEQRTFPGSWPKASSLTTRVLTVRVTGSSYVDKFHDYTRAYPECGYGLRFFDWVYEGKREPYNRWGNGSAMRVSPVAFRFDALEDVVKQARVDR